MPRIFFGQQYFTMATPAKSKKPRKPRVKKSAAQTQRNSVWKYVLLTIGCLGLVGGVGYHYRVAIAYYLSFRTDKQLPRKQAAELAHEAAVMDRNVGNVLGIDVSHYQGKIDWDKVGYVNDTYPIHFAIVRATMGSDKVDKRFSENWKGAAQAQLVRGAYHYYRPNENSTAQATHFLQHVKLEAGDFPAVLDIEEMPKVQSMEQLKKGLQNWLDRVEKATGVRPILYTGERFYADFLAHDFPDYHLWVANYNKWVEEPKTNWLLWQFSEKGQASGIKGPVDLNVFQGKRADLDRILKSAP